MRETRFRRKSPINSVVRAFNEMNAHEEEQFQAGIFVWSGTYLVVTYSMIAPHELSYNRVKMYLGS